jgi:hypothetical protein
MSDLTAPQLLAFRTTDIRDRYVAATGSAPAITLSHYNRATKTNFFSDEDLEALHDRLQVDYAEELAGVYDVKYAERLEEGDTEADAITAATAQKERALFALMRAECRQAMMEDAGFLSYLTPDLAKELFSTWKSAIERDRTFVRTRTSSMFSSVPLVRL